MSKLSKTNAIIQHSTIRNLEIDRLWKLSNRHIVKELIDHGMKDEIGTFIKDMGDRQQYAARDVLQWLGY
jgi:hypothetical protein